MTKVPIACTLTVADAHDRIDEWRAFVADHVVARADDEDGVRLRLSEGDHALLAAADLAGREKACCGFFTFAIEIDGDGRYLRIGGPAEARAVVTDFAAELTA